jgi:hypothetical protein
MESNSPNPREMCWIEMIDATRMPPKMRRTKPLTVRRKMKGPYLLLKNLVNLPAPDATPSVKAILGGMRMQGKQSSRFAYTPIRYRSIQ